MRLNFANQTKTHIIIVILNPMFCMPILFKTLMHKTWISTIQFWFYWQNFESISFQIYCKLDFSIYTEQICGYDPSKNSCQGDSGGPMTFMDANTQYLVGVASFGDLNCRTEG